MRRLIPLAVLFVTSAGALAQEASLASPVARTSEAKYRVRSFYVQNPPAGTATATIDISVQDSSNNEIRTASFSVPGCGTTTVGGLITAMITVRSTETGADSRKLQFRVIGYLSDQGCLPASTLTP